jgi:hypothetical protein
MTIANTKMVQKYQKVSSWHELIILNSIINIIYQVFDDKRKAIRKHKLMTKCVN